MKYKVIRTDTADTGIRKIILYVAQNFGNDVALKKLDAIEKRILELGDDPYIGTEPRYLVLKRQGYKVLILEKDLVFYKIDEENKAVVIYAVVDQRQDYLNIIRGLQNLARCTKIRFEQERARDVEFDSRCPKASAWPRATARLSNEAFGKADKQNDQGIS